jgi:hypothetical protein
MRPLALAIGTLLFGCAQPRSASTLLGDLPQPKQPYVGSIMYQPWTFDGVHRGHYRVTYAYGDGGFPRFQAYDIPRSQVVLDPQAVRSGDAVIIKKIDGQDRISIRPLPTMTTPPVVLAPN